MRRLSRRWLALAGPALLLQTGSGAMLAAQTAPSYTYTRAGEPNDRVTHPEAGFALMGGGKDLDAAFQWLGDRAHGGDFLVLRARGDDAYNPYIRQLAGLNSVATLIVPSRVAAAEPFVVEAIAQAEAIFIAGGDQADYINFWKGTPMQAALQDAVRRGVPIGGTSAGLAVQGEYIYSAQNDPADGPVLSSKATLANPFDPRITLVRGFLDNRLLARTITDSHFVARDRMGRLLTFMARIRQSGVPGLRAIGIDQGAAVLIASSGSAKIVGSTAAYFLTSTQEVRPLSRARPSAAAQSRRKSCTPERVSISSHGGATANASRIRSKGGWCTLPCPKGQSTEAYHAPLASNATVLIW